MVYHALVRCMRRFIRVVMRKSHIDRLDTSATTSNAMMSPRAWLGDAQGVGEEDWLGNIADIVGDDERW